VGVPVQTSRSITMDLRYTPEYDEFRREVRHFLEANWPLPGARATSPEAERTRVFRDLATAKGYLYRSIPRQYGGSEQLQDIFKSKIILEEFTASVAILTEVLGGTEALRRT